MDGTKRRFSVADGMILVGATALGMAAHKILMAGPRLSFLHYGKGNIVLLHESDLSPTLWAWTAASLLLGLRGRSLPLRLWLQRPGMSACVVAIASAVAEIFLLSARDWYVGMLDAMFPPAWSGWIARRSTTFVNSIHAVGPAVAATWLTQVMMGVWRPAPDWIDRSGRLLGVILIVIWLLVKIEV